MIPITVFAGRQVAVFGLGSSGLLSARALISGRRRGHRLRRQREEARRGASGRHQDAKSARARLVGQSPRWCSPPACRSRIRSRTGPPRSRARPMSRSSATSNCFAASAPNPAPLARSSPSPAPTANRPPPRSLLTCSKARGAMRRWAAISACRCWRSSRSRPDAPMCWKCRPTRSISRPRCMPPSAFCST